MSATKMNTFLHRMLKKNSTDELNVENDCEKEEQKSEPGKTGFSRGNWIKKLGNYSPSKYQAATSPVKINTMKALDRSGVCNSYGAETPRKSSGSPQTPLEMPDLESIIREFEMGFLSPSKHDVATDGSKQKNFVKKIVAAFEVKYKTYNDLKAAQEASLEGSKLDTALGEPSRRRSGIFSGPFKSSAEESRGSGDPDDFTFSKQNQAGPSDRTVRHSPSKSNSEAFKRISGIFGSPFKISFDEEEYFEDPSKVSEEETKNEKRRSGIFYTPSKDRSVDSKSSKISGIFSSPFGKGSSKDTSRISSDIYTSPFDLDRHDSKDSSSDCSSLFKFDKEASSRRSNFHFSPLKVSSLDDTKTMDSIDLEVTLPEPEETIFLAGNKLRKTSTMIHELSTDEDNATARRSSCPDKTPKIVGAFLKKPIDVEDTSIDWIPITGKKLPRKRSLKKLLYSLTGKKHEKKNKLFSSARSLNEEKRELQDSGYDEKSCSSSSLTSLISITEVLLQQGNSYVEPERRIALRTFGSRNSLNEEEDEAFSDTYRTTGKPSRRKLLLTEVPRENLKLDLGPCYPPSKTTTMSLGRKVATKKSSPSPVRTGLPRVPRHPFLSKIPKHPFVSTTKLDEDEEHDSQEHRDSEKCRGTQESSVIVKNDLYEVEFRRSCDDICSSASCRSSSSATSNYDTPRRFLSKSENEIPSLCESVVIRRQREPIYDVPRSRANERPKSSVFEDALSLKRRSTHLPQTTPFSMYAVPRDLECHYATVKPRNTRVYPNSEMLRSYNDLTCMEKSSAFRAREHSRSVVG